MAKAELKIIGSSPARMGGVERVVGKGVYGIDLMLKDQLHGAILRSQYAHAKIVSIDTSEAKKIPGVHDCSHKKSPLQIILSQHKQFEIAH